MSALAFAGGPIKVLKGGSGFLKGTKVFQAGSRAFSTLDASTRVGYMALRAQQLGTTAAASATSASRIWRAVGGTAKDPTVAGMLFKAGDEIRGLWANLADHPIKYIPVANLSGGLTVTHTPVAAR